MSCPANDSQIRGHLGLLLLAVLGAAEVQAQSIVTSKPDAPAAQARIQVADACKLLTQADLEVLFPAGPITKQRPDPEPDLKGLNMPRAAMYMIKLPSPTSNPRSPNSLRVTS